MTENEQSLMTPQEVADYLQLPVGTLYGWRYKSTGPPAVRLGRHLRYRRDDLMRWLSDLDQAAVKRQ